MPMNIQDHDSRADTCVNKIEPASAVPLSEENGAGAPSPPLARGRLVAAKKAKSSNLETDILRDDDANETSASSPLKRRKLSPSLKKDDDNGNDDDDDEDGASQSSSGKLSSRLSSQAKCYGVLVNPALPPDGVCEEIVTRNNKKVQCGAALTPKTHSLHETDLIVFLKGSTI